MNKSAFNKWIARHYLKIRERLSVQNSLDEDSLQDAYLLAIRTDGNVEIDGFLRLFFQCYRRARKREVARSYVFIYPDPLFFLFLREDEADDEERQQKNAPTEQRILQFINLHSTKSDMELFSLYVFQGLSYRDIADCKGCSPATVKRKIDHIKQEVKQYFTAI